ncbi:MAG: two-component regulator propeller domain-containing protein [Melioribacteraceae bacterium]
MILFISLQNFAQIKIHKSISTENGLVQSQISALMQDNKGYIWIGTFDGISRWDGNDFMNIQSHNGLPASQILDIAQDINGSIYIAAYGGGVLAFNNGKLDTIDTKDGLLTNGIVQIKKLRNGEILFAGDDGNISKLSKGKLTNWSKLLNFPKNDVYGIYESPNGKLYFATERGLVIVENNYLSILTTKDGLLTDWLWSVNGDESGTIFIGTNRGLNKLVNGKVSAVEFNGNVFRNAVFKIHISVDVKTYFATNAGILVKNNNNYELLTTENGLASNDNWTILEDNNGLMYFGSNGKGVSIYDPKEKIINFKTITKLVEEKVLSIQQGNNGNYYFGTRSGLVELNNDKYKIYRTYEDERSDIISLVFKRNNGEILLGTKNGLKIFTNQSIKPFIQNPDLLNADIFTIAEVKDGELFIGTQQGVYSIKNNKVEKLKYFDQLESIYILSILATENNGIIFGSFDKGLFILQNGNYSQITTEDNLSSNRINCLYQTNSGTVLIGTQNGLNILENKKITKSINVNNGLISNAIADINEDKNGRIFVSTFKGLNIIYNLNDSLKIRSITNQEGLINDNCLNEASYIDFAGNLWVATQSGITKYNPENDKENKTSPKIYLTGFEIFNVPINLNDFANNPNLSYDQNYLKFIYIGINFTAPQKIKYSYYLFGVDKDWVLSNNNSVQYTHLDKGNYLFQVKAMNEWGYWSKPVQFAFTIMPAWWETWWFRLLIISIIGSLLWLAFQYRLNYLLKLERLRTKIASDLHDDVGSLLTQISMNVDLLGYQKDTYVIKEKSSFIRSKCSEVIGIMSDIVWSIDARNDNLESFIDRVFNFASNFVKEKNIELKFVNNVTKKQNLLKIDVRQNLMMIAKEAINNAVKYSNCNLLEVEFDDSSNLLMMKISDNGNGFDMDLVKKGNGLKNMKMRAEAIKAKIEFLNYNGFSIKIII